MEEPKQTFCLLNISVEDMERGETTIETTILKTHFLIEYLHYLQYFLLSKMSNLHNLVWYLGLDAVTSQLVFLLNPPFIIFKNQSFRCPTERGYALFPCIFWLVPVMSFSFFFYLLTFYKGRLGSKLPFWSLYEHPKMAKICIT